MEKIKPIELTRNLNKLVGQTNDKGQIYGNSYTLFEELWGLENGIYVPIGRLALPAIVQVDEVFPGKDYQITLFSQFAGGDLSSCDNICEGIVQRYGAKETKDACLERDIVHYPSSGEVEILVTSGELNETPFDLIMKRHIPEFLKLYDQTKGMPATTESLQNIRKAFVDYRS